MTIKPNISNSKHLRRAFYEFVVYLRASPLEPNEIQWIVNAPMRQELQVINESEA